MTLFRRQVPSVALLSAIIAEVAGGDVAEANAEATAKVQRGILVDCLVGSNGRAKVDGWLPRWFAFPPSAYTARGGMSSPDGAAANPMRQQQDSGPSARPQT